MTRSNTYLNYSFVRIWIRLLFFFNSEGGSGLSSWNPMRPCNASTLRGLVLLNFLMLPRIIHQARKEKIHSLLDCVPEPRMLAFRSISPRNMRRCGWAIILSFQPRCLRQTEELHKMKDENKKQLIGRNSTEKSGDVLPFLPKVYHRRRNTAAAQLSMCNAKMKLFQGSIHLQSPSTPDPPQQRTLHSSP